MIEKEEFRRLLGEIVRNSNNSVRLILKEQDLQSIKEDSLTDAITQTFPNGDDSLLTSVSDFVSKGNQVAIQAAGPDKLLVIAAPNLFHEAGKVDALQSLFSKLDQLSAKYPNAQGEPLFLPTTSYLKPLEHTALAEKHSFKKVASFAIRDHAVVDEIEKYLKQNQMVILAGYTEENRADVWVMPEKKEWEKKSGCFIATAAFENEFAPEVTYLRRYRDCVLNNSRRGRIFIHMYYLLSPPVAKVISKSIALKTFTREILLKPMIRLLGYSEETKGSALDI